jgi:hypothetical protein
MGWTSQLILGDHLHILDRCHFAKNLHQGLQDVRFTSNKNLEHISVEFSYLVQVTRCYEHLGELLAHLPGPEASRYSVLFLLNSPRSLLREQLQSYRQYRKRRLVKTRTGVFR